MSKKHVKAVIWDADGVLFDTYRTALEKIQKICASHGHPIQEHHKPRLVEHWGVMGPELFIRAMDLHPHKASAIYHDWEKLDAVDEVQLVEGALHALRWCNINGIKQCMLTSRFRTSLDPIILRHGLGYFFDYIIAAEDTVHHKPHPRAFESILMYLKKHEIDRRECLFVGDTRVDIEAGRHAHVTTVVVGTGPYHDGHYLTHPVHESHVLPSAAEVPSWIMNRQ